MDRSIYRTGFGSNGPYIHRVFLQFVSLTTLWFTLFSIRPLFSGADNKTVVHWGSVKSKKLVLIFSVRVRGPKKI